MREDRGGSLMAVDFDPEEFDPFDDAAWLELLDDAIADYVEDVVGGDYE